MLKWHKLATHDALAQCVPHLLETKEEIVRVRDAGLLA
jgi:hypothetical protein